MPSAFHNLVRFAIRDDDTSYWTSPKELEDLYKDLWASGIRVSLSVTPFAVESVNRGGWEHFYQNGVLQPLAANPQMVDFLRDCLRKEYIAIMLHGYSHQYGVSSQSANTPVLALKDNVARLKRDHPGGRLLWHGEYNWKPYDQLKKETRDGKEYLEDLLHTRITVFVPPSNDISRQGIQAVAETGMNLSGTILLKKFNRPFTLAGIKNWLIQLGWRLAFKRGYPHVMAYGDHKELCAYGLVPGVSSADLLKALEFCRGKNAPYVLASHSWELASQAQMRTVFREVIDRARNLPVEPAFLGDLFGERT